MEFYPHQVTECKECKSLYDANLYACPNCGFPNVAHITPEKKKTVTSKLLVPIFLAIFAIIVFFTYQKIIERNYYNNLRNITYTMLDGAANAETASNLISQVWSDTIYEKNDPATSKYTIIDGSFVSDFNDALSNLFADPEFIDSLSEIQANQDDVNNAIQGLRNPPKKYESAYNDFKTYYDYYIKMTNMALNPTGSLNSYSEEFSQVDADTLDAFNRMKLYLD